MSLNFIKLCESVLDEVEILEESKKLELDKLSRKALNVWKLKNQSNSKEEAMEHVRELFNIRKEYLETLRRPDLYTTTEITEEKAENLLNAAAKNEVQEHPRVHGTHYLTLGYLSQFRGNLSK